MTFRADLKLLSPSSVADPCDPAIISASVNILYIHFEHISVFNGGELKAVLNYGSHVYTL